MHGDGISARMNISSPLGSVNGNLLNQRHHGTHGLRKLFKQAWDGSSWPVGAVHSRCLGMCNRVRETNHFSRMSAK